MLVVQSAVLAGFAYGPAALFFVKRGVLILVASDTALAHLLVRAHVVFRELLLAEYDIETHSEDADSDQGGCDEKHFHILVNEVRTDRFVIVNLVNDACEYRCH